MKHIKGLDALRAFAVFFVLIEHKGIWFDDTVTNGRFIKEVIIPDGGFGVTLFFVLSGFLITSILLSQRDQGNDASRSVVLNFFARRSLRIFPIYFLMVLFLYLINYSGFKENILYHLTYTTNILCYKANQWNSFSHTWTLSVEEQFYLLWPWLIVFVPARHLRNVILGSILVGIVSAFYCMELKGHMAPLLVFNCFDSFGIGGLLAYSLLNENSCKRFRQWLNWLTPLAMCVYLYWKLGTFFHFPTYGIVFSKTINSIISVWLILAVVRAKPSIFRRYFLENRFLTFVGKISYGIYLYHYIYNSLVYYQLNDYLARITTGHDALNRLVRDTHFYYWLHVASVIVISTCSYYAIERPFLMMKKYFGYNKELHVAMPVAGELNAKKII